MKTLEQVKKQFLESGVPVSAWARENGFSPALVHQVLSGNTKCSRGQSHRIAVILQLKDGTTGWMNDLPSINEREKNEIDIKVRNN